MLELMARKSFNRLGAFLAKFGVVVAWKIKVNLLSILFSVVHGI
jgi:hypothetical protein